MKQKPYTIGILAAGLTLASVCGVSGYSRIATSARTFQQYFHTMQSTAGSLGPFERFVYSLVLANHGSPSRPPRT